MAIYKITNRAAGKCLNIDGDNVTSLINNQNVTLWSDSGTNEQRWDITSLGTGVLIKSIINNAYALNVYQSGNPYNCDVYPWSGNETDAKVTFIQVGNYYRIKLTNYSLYLTATSSSNGANVTWQALNSNSYYQMWSCNVCPNAIFSNYHILGYNGHGRCVNIYTNNAVSGNPVTLYDWDNNDDQRWTLERYGTDSTGNYTYIIKSAHSGLYLGYTGATYNGLKACNVTNSVGNALVTLEPLDSSNIHCKIKMAINGTTHYLTPWYGTSDADSRLIWHTSLKTYDQCWKFVSGNSHPCSHTSSIYGFGWPAVNTSLVNDGYNGLWRQYTDLPGVTSNHDGVDIAYPNDGLNRCYSMFAGTVTEVHTSLDTERGRYVKVVSNGYTAIYQHLASVNVSYGSNIAKGAVIGVIGGSGLYNENAYDKHLHFEVWHNSNIDDPLKYFD